MAAQEYPPIPDEDFPKPDKDEQYTHVERLLGYAPKRKRMWLRVVLIVLAVLVLAGAGYFIWKGWNKPARTTSTPHVVSTNNQAPTAQTVKTKLYSSTNFNLGFDYPETWNVADDGSGKLTATSPVQQLKDAGGKTVNGRVVLTIQNNQTALPDFKAGNAVAAITSEKLSYAKPTQDQRAQTYISFLNYAGSKGNGLDGIYITGDNGYQVGQAIPQADVVKTDPLITVTFTQCADTACSSGGTALTVAPSMWNDSGFNTLIKTTLASLAIQ